VLAWIHRLLHVSWFVRSHGHDYAPATPVVTPAMHHRACRDVAANKQKLEHIC
jgi:hypothetical protein